MMAQLKRCFAVLLILVCLFGMVGCTKADDSLLLSEAERLLRLSLVYNDLLFEKGIPLNPVGAISGIYQEADKETLIKEYGFSNLADIKNGAKQVYTQAAVADLFRLSVESMSDGTSLLRSAYCYDSKDGVLYVSREGLNYQTDEVSFDYTTLKVKEKKRDVATLTILAQKDGDDKSKVIEVTMKYEGGVWLLDSLTCIRF